MTEPKGTSRRKAELERLAREQRADARSSIVAPEKAPRKQAGRHDKGDAPKNHHFVASVLVPDEPKDFGPADDRTVAIARALVTDIAGMFRLDETPVAAILFGVLREATPNAEKLIEHADALENAYEAIHGHRFGERAWWEDLLAGQIEMAARRAYEREHFAVELDRRQRDAKRGLETDLPIGRPAPVKLLGPLGEEPRPPAGAFEVVAPGTEGAAVLEYLGWVADGAGGDAGKTPLPAELTAGVIQGMIERCAVGENRAGGGRKPANTLVAEFKKTLG